MDDEIQDMNKIPLDVEEKLTQMLSEELSKEIDKEILNSIFDQEYQEELDRYNKTENRKRKISDIFDEEYIPSKPPEKRKFDGTD